MGSYRSKEDDVAKISTSVYVTNFPESVFAKELFNSYKVYGHVVDSFIPNKAVKGNEKIRDVEVETQPAMDLNDECLISRDLSKSLMGRVKEFASLVNLKMTLNNKGFMDVKIQYLGEFWVMLEFVSKETMKKFQDSVSIGSWFSVIKAASMEFQPVKWIAWVEVEGIPFKLWSGKTFIRIVNKWGELLDVDDQEDTCFHSKWLCIHTKMDRSISEEFQIIHRGKTYWVRANETPGWVSDFLDEFDEEDPDDNNVNDDEFKEQNPDLFRDDSDEERIPDSLFQEEVQGVNNMEEGVTEQDAEQSDDPFNIYPMLNKLEKTDRKENISDGSLKYLPGYSPKENHDENSINGGGDNKSMENSIKKNVTSKNCKFTKQTNDGGNDSISSEHFKVSEIPRNEGSILGLLDEVVKAGQGLAQKAKKDWVKELCNKNKVNFLGLQETKMNDMHIQCVRACWGNLAFDYVHSAAVGNSGGILCVWDSNSFDKESVTSSDYVVLIRGIWRLTGQKLVLVAVYAPQDAREKNMLWDYLQREISRRKGKVVIMETLIRSDANLIDADYGPIPFKIFHYWFDIEGFNKVVEDVWNDYMREEANKMSMSVRGVMVDGVWVDDPHKVKKEFLDHFSARFCKPNKKGASILMDFPNKISAAQLRDLECEVSNEEIKRVVWDCGTEKAPGPDGFTFGFFRCFWYLIHGDVVAAVRYFFLHTIILKGCNLSFIALIPKTPNVNLVNDFRPISLIESLYKIIAKFLANRLVGVLDDIVNEVQSAFIKDRQILDGPFILNEVLQWCKTKKKQALIFKVNFEKAYDSVRWDFLNEVLRKFGFGDKWCKWIQCCLKSLRGSIIMNGSPIEEFQFG
uniref:RNA-directed DNA polymerase, eukaryota, reverse transcriptase zinc-binding domain protein n=1 Tax=Tanacetum cinerariifolium TaxID=118510 RepID=A0A699HB26_TANCI|nr:RNA-directed DNA polymerase, eukaryota, reverse transcriptase zinc-binding domain protein [Tanacetum cinerariifolium]